MLTFQGQIYCNELIRVQKVIMCTCKIDINGKLFSVIKHEVSKQTDKLSHVICHSVNTQKKDKNVKQIMEQTDPGFLTAAMLSVISRSPLTKQFS